MGHDRIFLISEPDLLKGDLVLADDLRQVILTLQLTYNIHTMILSPWRINHPSFANPYLDFDVPDFNFPSRVIHISFLVLKFTFPILTLGLAFGSKSTSEIREHNESVVGL